MSVQNSINDDGILYLYQVILSEMPKKVSDLNNDLAFQTATQVGNAIQAAIAGLSIPSKTSDLTNDLDFQSATQVQTAINSAIAGIENLTIDWTYSQLPASGDKNTIYAIPTGDQEDPYDFYVWKPGTPGSWVKLDFKIDMSGYMKTTDIHWMTNSEIEALIHPTTP